MRKFIAISLCTLFLATGITSCTTYRTGSSNGKRIPPGQAKKITGSKSAKAYAPGQRKKHKH